MALGPEGRTYVLEHSLLLAFEADGKPAAGFGVDGRVAVDPVGESEVQDLAVDSQGRVLVTGSAYLGYQEREGHPSAYAQIYTPYVIRFLPDGNRDVTFGNSGEVQATFGLPRPTGPDGTTYERASAISTSIVVDSKDRPIIGGGYAASYQGCQTIAAPDPFVARLTVGGAPDTTFAGKGYALDGGLGEVSALALTPEGGPATLSYGVSCGARSENQPSRFTAFNEGGRPAPGLDPHRPKFFMEQEMAIDPMGRILVVQIPPPTAEGPASLVRLLPSGTVDTSFGTTAVVLGRPGYPLRSPSTPRLGRSSRGPKGGSNCSRLTANGSAIRRFGAGGRHYRQGRDGPGGGPRRAGPYLYDGRSRRQRHFKTGYGVQVARFVRAGKLGAYSTRSTGRRASDSSF